MKHVQGSGQGVRRIDASPPAARRRSLPLFLRIFAVVLGGVLCAQALDFASLLLVRLPQPQIYLLSEVAGALRSGQDQSSLMTISLGAPRLNPIRTSVTFACAPG